MKNTIISLAFMLIAVCAFAQAPEWQWATQAGGSGHDKGSAIVIDDNGNSYISGYFQDTATFGSYSLTCSGSRNIFVAKMDTNGNWLWATKANGMYVDEGYAITIDDNGNSYVTGFFSETVSFGSYSITSIGSKDIFVAKMDTNGNWLWATQAGGSGNDIGYSIAIDNNENCFVTGYFEYTATFGSYSLTNSGYKDIFVAKVDVNGNWLWATQAGGNQNDKGRSIAIDDNGNSFVTGYFSEAATFGSYSLTNNGLKDIFLAKMDANGNWLWASQAGGNENDIGFSIAIDDNGNSLVTGYFQDTATFGSFSLTCSGYIDIFVAKMDANGNWLWATKSSGSNADNSGNSIVIDNDGNGYLTGCFGGAATFGSYSLNGFGFFDIFAAKIDTDGIWLWATQAGGNGSDSGYNITIDSSGNSYVTGCFENIAIFDSYSLTSCGNQDIFIAKLGNDTSVENEIIPTKMELLNYPNPFNPSTTISFSIPEESKIEVSIYNIKGQKVKPLLYGQIQAGEHSIVWNGEDASGKQMSSGVYLYKLKIDNKTELVKKCLLLK